MKKDLTVRLWKKFHRFYRAGVLILNNTKRLCLFLEKFRRWNRLRCRVQQDCIRFLIFRLSLRFLEVSVKVCCAEFLNCPDNRLEHLWACRHNCLKDCAFVILNRLFCKYLRGTKNFVCRTLNKWASRHRRKRRNHDCSAISGGRDLRIWVLLSSFYAENKCNPDSKNFLLKFHRRPVSLKRHWNKLKRCSGRLP